jgi:hypothetical protein
MKTIAFFVRHFTERGTEVSIYNYAHYNETILGHRSIIVGFDSDTCARIGVDFKEGAFQKFHARFPVFLVSDISEVEPLLIQQRVDLFYTQTHGSLDGDRYPYGYTQTIPSLIHAVFTTREPHGTHYVSIGEDLNTRLGTSVPVLPYIADVADTNETLRDELRIPADARVFGQYGGHGSFDIDFVRAAIEGVVQTDPDIYFIFMNLPAFCKHDRVMFLPASVDVVQKRKFINTCDAMIHARRRGETFGLAVAEFAVCGRPVFTYALSEEREHLIRLGESAIRYENFHDVFTKLLRFVPHTIDISRTRYGESMPGPVMKRFMEIVGWSI